MSERQFVIDKREKLSIESYPKLLEHAGPIENTRHAPKQEILRLFHERKVPVKQISLMLHIPYHTVYAVIRRSKHK
jgi:Homeodomain-like domain